MTTPTATEHPVDRSMMPADELSGQKGIRVADEGQAGLQSPPKLKAFRCAQDCQSEEEWNELVATSQGEFIGNFKDRLEFTGTITYHHKWETEFGDQHLTIIADDKGNCIKYRNELHKTIILPDKRKVVQGLRKGDRVTFNATVIDHGVYEHPATHERRKETLVQRAHVKDYALRGTY